MAACVKTTVYGKKNKTCAAETPKCDWTTPNIMYTFIYCNKATGTLNLMWRVSSGTGETLQTPEDSIEMFFSPISKR